MLEELPPIIATKQGYRADRYLYYFVVPHLSRILWFKPDRDRLKRIEIDLYNDLLSQSFIRGTFREPIRVPLWYKTNPGQ